MSKYFVLVVASMSIATVANAKCVKAQVCDDYGMNCRVQQICGSSLDLPSIGVDPIRPLPSAKLKPLPSINLPPLGTTKCQYKQVNGFWQNVCR
jgi:hypothetical protein